MWNDKRRLLIVLSYIITSSIGLTLTTINMIVRHIYTKTFVLILLYICILVVAVTQTTTTTFITSSFATAFRPTTTHVLHPHQQSGSKVFLSSSSSTAESLLSSKFAPGPTKSTSVVLYQKVIRSPPKSDPSLLLGLLFEYLQDDFVLPDRLPMIYHSVDETSLSSSSLGLKQHESVLIWNSPLSPNPLLTALYVNVIAINNDVNDDDDDDDSSSSSVKDSNSYSNTPSMAMVVVEKVLSSSSSSSTSSSSSNKSIPPMLMNLFAASEKQIIRALDRGLDEFMMVMPNTRRNRSVQNNQQNSKKTLEGYDTTLTPQENAMIAAAQIYDDPSDTTSDVSRFNNESDLKSKSNASTKTNKGISKLDDINGIKNNAILDASIIQRNGVNIASTDRDVPPGNSNEFVKNESQKRQRQQNAVLQSMKYNTTTTQNTPGPEQRPPSVEGNMETSVPPMGLDYAVHAAKMAQAKRKKSLQQQEISTISETANVASEDYAVQQAVKVSTERRSKQQSQLPTVNISNNNNNPNVVDPILQSDSTMEQQQQLQSQRSPMLDDALSRRSSRSFMTTISTPNDYASLQNQDVMSSSTPSSGKNPVVQGSKVDITNVVKSLSNDPTRPESDETGISQKRAIESKTINLNVRDNEKEPFESSEVSTFENLSSNGTDEIFDLTQMALDEMTEQNAEDLTPEELLAKVMKYGAEQEVNERDGTGFVSAAFDKAKSLLREQSERREVRLQQERQQERNFDEMTTMDNLPTTEVLSPSEELRRMFMAGESIAESRITTSTTTASGSIGGKRITTEQDIDALIESEKTVTRHARVLDEELTELMVRINKSPTEDSDGVGRHQFFDVLSGPEVYDQNVDPLTAVNWPGALPGSKTVRLPKELDEAVRQAKFAAGVLTSVEEVESMDGLTSYRVGTRELSAQQLSNLQAVVKEAVEIGLIDDPLILQQEEARLQMLLDELSQQPEERMREVASNYKDLLLSENFITLVENRLNQMVERDLDALRRDDDSFDNIHTREREILGQLVVYAQLLLKEVQALGAELESQQLEVIRSICKVAMDPTHRTEEETAMALSDAVRDMRPLFDDGFIAYLKYAVAEEEGRLARAGLLHDPEYNQWLFVLKIVQQGVHAEIAKGINRYLEHIWYILRMETPTERRMLLEKLVDVMPTLDVRPFVQVVENIVGALGDSVRGEFDGGTALGEMTNKLLQLHRDLRDVLPNDRIAKMSRDADEWAAKQKQRLLEQRNLTKQRLKAAQETEHLDNEIEEFGKRGEVERFD